MQACSQAKPNSLFGPYRVGRRIGRGGMAETFAASRDLGTGARQDVCLKCMLPGLIEDPELARAFLEEARLAAQLVHTNIAALIDHGTVGETHYLALELIDGVDLRGLLREAHRRGERLPPDIVAEIAFALAHALDYAHAIRRDSTLAGAVHRDISPSNVLLGVHGEVKLADFGIAKVAGASHHTRTGLLKGKIPYLPPEYICGGEYAARGDLFALGVTLFECLAGTRPFDGAQDVETLHRITEGSRRTLAELAPDVPRLLADPIEALLSLDPDDRPRDSRALLAMLAPAAPAASTRARLSHTIAALRAPRLATAETPRLASVEAPRSPRPGERTGRVDSPPDATLHLTSSLGFDVPRVRPALPDDPTRTRFDHDHST